MPLIFHGQNVFSLFVYESRSDETDSASLWGYATNTQRLLQVMFLFADDEYYFWEDYGSVMLHN